MSLSAAAQLLTSAFMLLQLLIAHPELPQSMRDSATTVAQNAISQATTAITAQQTAGAQQYALYVGGQLALTECDSLWPLYPKSPYLLQPVIQSKKPGILVCAGFLKDSNKVYLYQHFDNDGVIQESTDIVEGADPATFVTFTRGSDFDAQITYAKDATSVYAMAWECDAGDVCKFATHNVPYADPGSFSLVGGAYYDAYDNAHKFYRGGVVDNVAPEVIQY